PAGDRISLNQRRFSCAAATRWTNWFRCGSPGMTSVALSTLHVSAGSHSAPWFDRVSLKPASRRMLRNGRICRLADDGRTWAARRLRHHELLPAGSCGSAPAVRQHGWPRRIPQWIETGEAISAEVVEAFADELGRPETRATVGDAMAIM